MRTIGLIGGMSWESSAVYYRLVNEGVRARLGGLHSADLVMVSVDFQPLERLQAEGRWDEAGDVLARAAVRLERAGAAFVVLCTNTMHRVADRMIGGTSIPLLHIGEATADDAVRRGLRSVVLLGTRYTMELPFYRERLERRGIRVLVPEEADRERVHRVIYDELCLGRVEPSSRAELVRITAGLGADGVVLGCTELTLLLSEGDLGRPVLDTTAIHAAAAVEQALR